jgi:hypothetical protein
MSAASGVQKFCPITTSIIDTLAVRSAVSSFIPKRAASGFIPGTAIDLIQAIRDITRIDETRLPK